MILGVVQGLPCTTFLSNKMTREARHRLVQ